MGDKYWEPDFSLLKWKVKDKQGEKVNMNHVMMNYS